MPRPKRCRRVCSEPEYSCFEPEGVTNPESVVLYVDEYEVIRLVDFEKQNHEQCAAVMDISRTTVTEIYERARYKISDCIVNGKQLVISGGNYRICSGKHKVCCERPCRRYAENSEKNILAKGQKDMKEMSVNEKSYVVLKLLGHGKGGYSYLVTDGTKEYVLKQIHHEPCDYYQFGNKIESEIKDYVRLKEIGIPMPAMLAVDMENERILKEYIKGDTIFDYVLQNEVKPAFVKQVKEMCVDLYAANINIDYFPTNFVVQDEKLYYIDYECNDYMAEWNFENWGIQYWSQTKAFWEYVNTR